MNAALELIAAGLRSDDPDLAVEPLTDRTWLRPDPDKAYVDVREADVQPDGRVRVSALVTRLAGPEPLAVEVPQAHQSAMLVGTTSIHASRPLRAYLPGAVLWSWQVEPNVGHPARSRVTAAGHLAAVQTEFPDDATRAASLRAALLDIAAQHYLPALATDKVLHGALWEAGVRAVSPDDYQVGIRAQDRVRRTSCRTTDGEPIDEESMRYAVSADEAEAWLDPWVNRLSVPDVGNLSAVTTNGQTTVLSFRRPNEEN